MTVASKTKRDRLALFLLILPTIVVIAGLGYVLPITGFFQKSQVTSLDQNASANLPPTRATGGKSSRSQSVEQALAAYRNKDLEGARKSLQSQVTLGDISAAGPYAYLLVSGEGLKAEEKPKSWEEQYALAKPLIEKGMAIKDAWAQAAMGMMLTQAWGEQRDMLKGLALLKEAASAEHAGAIHALGMIYANGAHVPVNLVEARKWFVLGAAQNTPEDIYNLGLMDWNGAGISAPNQKSAMALWNRAAKMNEPRAIRAIANGGP